MVHEIGQYDITDRQLLAAKAQARVGKDIGEAKITRTIFGSARVRIIREQDKKRRAWLLAALALAALSAAAWQGWIAMNQTAPPHLSATVRVGAPAFQPEYLPVAAPPPARIKPGTPSQSETINPGIIQKSAPQQAPGLKASEQVAAKPVASRPLTAGKPQTAPLATNSNPARNQTDVQQLTRLSAPVQPATSDVKKPIAAVQPAASSAAAVAPLAEPLVREVTPTPLTTAIDQPSGPVDAQSN